METLLLMGMFILGGAVGALFAWMRFKAISRVEVEELRVNLAKLQSENNVEADKVRWMEDAEGKLREAFESLASKSLRHNADAFLKQAQTQMTGVLKEVRGDWNTQKSEMKTLMNPVRENLDKLDGHVRSLEQKREGAYRELGGQLKELADAHHKLQRTAFTLSQALTSSSVRGQWGEVQLRRVVEMAGMERWVAFEEQAVSDAGRPDMIVRLPDGGELPVDAKTPLTAYLAASEAGDDPAKYKQLMQDHTRAFQNRVRELGRKAYWSELGKTPEFVVMFVPVEASVAAAFNEAPGLFEDALRQKVLIATPVTLLALLKAVVYGWQQQEVSENARRIADEGKTLHKRIEIFCDHLKTVGTRLTQTVDSYNQSVGSLEQNLWPSVRRFQRLGVSNTELDVPDVLDQRVRSLSVGSE